MRRVSGDFMEKETEAFLSRVQKHLYTGEGINPAVAKDYMQNLSKLYHSDLTFRLLFEYYFTNLEGTRINLTEMVISIWL